MRCAVAGCNTDNGSKDFTSNLMLFRFPTDDNIQKLWVAACKRADKISVKTARVCSKHFNENSYERNLRFELLGYSARNRRLLKKDAVPFLNLPLQPKYVERVMARDNRISKRSRCTLQTSKIIIMDEDLGIGVRFPSYHLLMHHLEKFTKETQCKFWKRDARTIGAARSLGVTKHLNPDLIYFELKFSCIYGGVDFKTKGRNIRPRQPSLKTNGCPVFLRFKASEDGEALQLVAKNLHHNHELKLPTKKKKASVDFALAESQKKKSKLEDMDDIEKETTTYNEEEDEDDEFKEDYPDKEEVVKYEGLLAPVFTPFNNDPTRSLNFDILPTYAQYLIDNGITGVLVNGTAGEGAVMTVEERKLVAEVWAQLCAQGQLHLMVHVGGAPLPDVLELSQHAEQIGANSILCLPELYHKPATCEDLIRYLQIVSQAASSTPLFYYHIPSYSGVNLHMGEFLNKVQDTIPTFNGIKFTSTVLDEGYAAVKACNERYTIFLGADTVMAGAYALGFESSIATSLNMLPQFGQQIVQCIKDGNIKEAQEKQNDLNSAIQIITKYGAWVPSMKMAMNLLSPLDLGPTREPIKSLTAEEAKQMENELMSLSFITS